MTVLDPVLRYLSECGLRRVNLQQVIDGAERPRKPVLRVLDKLCREGFLKQVADEPIAPGLNECGPPRRNPTWSIVKSPVARPTGPEPRINTQRDRLWRVIRAKRYFTKADLAITAGVKPDTADNYVRLLERHNHVRRTGKDGGRVTYMLLTRSVQRPLGMDGAKPNGGRHG